MERHTNTSVYYRRADLSVTRGTILRHYPIGSKIGEGGMGVVYDSVDVLMNNIQ